MMPRAASRSQEHITKDTMQIIRRWGVEENILNLKGICSLCQLITPELSEE